MISELSQEAQYICTTFRAELIPHADAYFGVVFNQAKISNVKTRASLPHPLSYPLSRARVYAAAPHERVVWDVG